MRELLRVLLGQRSEDAGLKRPNFGLSHMGWMDAGARRKLLDDTRAKMELETRE